LKKSVLLISYYFAPQNAIGAVRPTKLAKYLTRMGYDVTVLCGVGLSPMRDPLLARDLQELRDVHTVQERSLLRWLKTRKQEASKDTVASNGATITAPSASVAKSGLGSLRNDVYLWLHTQADEAFARACIRRLRAMHRHFDVVLSTYGPLSAHTVGSWVKRTGMADKWIADFRDEVTVPFRWQQKMLLRYIRNVRLNADAITAVSEGCLQVMGLEALGSVIHNGFDAEDLAELVLPPKRRDRLAFIHCGQMYGARRDLSPFFRALRELIDEGSVDASRVALVYAGWDTGGFVSQATAAGLGDCLEGHGFLPRDESLLLQKASHVLLLAAWNYRDHQGNLPGKFLEYLMLGMPVLSCVTGDTPDSEIAKVMRNTHTGFCYEQANAAQDSARLKAYVRELYESFAATGAVPFSPNTAQIAAFGYAGAAETFAKLLERV
jgi:glycosyltransferase involved in cell wall biosynthesis